MFEAVELGQSLSKEEFKSREDQFRSELLEMQRQLRAANIATLVIVSGVSTAGKGHVVNQLNKWFDSRGIETHAFWDETDEELQRPQEWRYWTRLPPRGSIGVMFNGWYGPAFHDLDQTDVDVDETARRIDEMERMLYQDGMLIIKLWFHLSKQTYKSRKNKYQKQRPYKKFLANAERVIRLTDSGESPWHLVEADDRWFRDASVASILLESMQQRLAEQRITERRARMHEQVAAIDDEQLTILDRVDLSANLSRKEYEELLDEYQQQLFQLSWLANKQKCSTVMVFEGWDAAGKGGAIRRITASMDARLYRVISIAAPSDEEKAHHYLWRFWRHIPRAGYMTMYDRSWYGRVLVERVEEFAQPHEWMRAYQEINDFEEQLTRHGNLLVKFWLHISNEEQLRRFNERESVEWKSYKITEEDWRNREKWDAYKQAVNTMVSHTSTRDAPWHLIAANNKHFARIEILRTVCQRLVARLNK